MDRVQEPPTAITDVVTGRRIDLLDYRQANVRTSWALIVFAFAFVIGIGYVMALALDPGSAAVFVGVAAVVAGVQGFTAYYYSDRVALAASGAREASVDEHRYLVNVTDAVAIGAGVPSPGIYVIDSPVPNAFATGRNPENAAIAVTTGLLEVLDRQELEGVVAHEMAHIKNFDIRVSSILVVLVGVILVLRHMVLRSMRWGTGRRSGGGGSSRRGGAAQGIFFVLLVVLLILGPILATLLRLAVSRRREYLADATGAYITRNPEGLARALEKIRDASRADAKLGVSEGIEHMLFTNPALGRNGRSWLATHPPIQERIDRLRRM